MTLSYDKSAATVVLPAIGGGQLEDRSLKAWLSRATIVRNARRQELLRQILDNLQLPYPASGLGALRMWGQTGDRPAVWIAAADPIYLEPQLDHLRLHALPSVGVPPADLRELFDHLQASIADGSGFGFARIGRYGYLRSEQAMATAAVPSYVVHGYPPDDYMPGGEEGAAFRRLLGEIEMSMHDHPVNQRREAAGQAPINSLWLWGGGLAPEPAVQPQPPLFSDDALLKGYWLSRTGVVAAWPGSIGACLEAAVAGFVATPALPQGNVAALENCLLELRDALLRKRLGGLHLMFADGIEVHVRRNDNLRVWRRPAAVFD